MEAPRNRLELTRHLLWVAAGLLGGAGLLLEYGFRSTSAMERLVETLGGLAVGLFLIELAIHFATVRPLRRALRQRWAALILATLLVSELLALRLGGWGWLAPPLRFFSIRSVTQAYVVALLFYVLGNFLVYLPRVSQRLAPRRIRPGLAFVLVFLGLILSGTVLLMLPRAAPAGRPLGPVNALFTSTSAVCVTGLIVVDTARDLTREGQLFVLLLIQLGGLGIMSLTATLSLLLGHGIGVRENRLLREVFQVPLLNEAGRLVRFIVSMTLVVEAVGAAVLVFALRDVVPDPGDRLFTAVFHAVSAFCNAGFSTFSDSLVGLADDGLVVGTIAALLIAGGLGFTVVANLLAFLKGRALTRARPAPRLDAQTRVVLVMTAVLLLAGTGLILALEWDRGLAGLAPLARLSRAFFQSATTRTAGFNSMDLGLLSTPSLFVMILLMFVGGGSGSTAGGVKLTTVAVMWANVKATGQGLRQARLAGRELSNLARERAMLVLTGVLVAAGTGTLVLLVTEGKDFLTVVFEVFSALGTVGLSLGLTPELTTAGRLTIVVLMFVGRLGPLTFAYGLAPARRDRGVRLPPARLMVG